MAPPDASVKISFFCATPLRYELKAGTLLQNKHWPAALTGRLLSGSLDQGSTPAPDEPDRDRALRLHPPFFGIIDVEEVVDMMTETCWYKLRDIIFHELLDSVRQLRKALIT